MTDLRTLLEEKGVRNALVIDDVFDDAPRPDEIDDGDWAVFLDDLDNASEEDLIALYPNYSNTHEDELRTSEKFIRILWENKNTLPACARMFIGYETINQTERNRMDRLVYGLRNLGLACEVRGRELDNITQESELIFIDLFLGRRQTPDDIRRSLDAVRCATGERAGNPPLVVLMSNNPRLHEERDQFRDEAGILGSTFRVVGKGELEQDDLFTKLITRLVSPYNEAKKVAAFIHAWESGLQSAQARFIRVLRRLDIFDLVQIQTLLLDFEKQNLGEYLLSVADKALQHEIENNTDTISAALALNQINSSKYLAPHLTGSTDLQELVHRMLFVHPERLRLSEIDGAIQLQFGDVFRWKDTDEVCMVVNPACDLARRSAKRVILLTGKLANLVAREWSCEHKDTRTAVAIPSGEEKQWIRWDLKDVQTLDWSEIDKLSAGQGKLQRIGRLRETHAIEIQQKLLANLGRIGRPANLPTLFPVSVEFFYVDTDNKAQKLDVSNINSAVCYVGREEGEHRLVFSEQACDEIEQTLRTLDESSISSHAVRGLQTIKQNQDFFMDFEHGGVQIPSASKEKFIEKDGNVCAVIYCRKDMQAENDVKGRSRNAALIIRVTDEDGSEND